MDSFNPPPLIMNGGTRQQAADDRKMMFQSASAHYERRNPAPRRPALTSQLNSLRANPSDLPSSEARFSSTNSLNLIKLIQLHTCANTPVPGRPLKVRVTPHMIN